MKKPFKAWSKKQWFQLIVIALVFALVAVAIYFFTANMLKLRDESFRIAFEQSVQALGLWGILIIIVFEVIQIVLAFIPGGPVQLIAGSLFGPVLGTVVCIAGTLIANAIIFLLVRKVGKKVVSLFVDEKDLDKYIFLRNTKKLERIIFILYFIPGTPKDALTYVFACSNISLKRFTFLATAARLPGVITSVLAGSYIIAGDWLKAVVTFCILGALSILGLIIKQKIDLSKNDEK